MVKVLARKVSESSPELCAQAIGSALFGLQRLSSDSSEVDFNMITTILLVMIKLIN